MPLFLQRRQQIAKDAELKRQKIIEDRKKRLVSSVFKFILK